MLQLGGCLATGEANAARNVMQTGEQA